MKNIGMIFETKRLYVRNFKLDDFDELHRLTLDPAIYKYFTWGPNSKQDTEKFIKTNIKNGGG